MDWKSYWNRSIFELGEDPCKQVGRTWRKKNYSEKQIQMIIERICYFLQASPQKKLLELACGNGMITDKLSPHFKHIHAIDFSKPLIEVAQNNFQRENIDYHVGDATDLPFTREEFDCVLIYFAFQYFTPVQAKKMFKQLDGILKPGGTILLGEVADGDRIWNFYKGISGRFIYYFNALRNKRIIGHWWRPSDILKLGYELGWDLSVFYQDQELPNYYFRYDALIKKPKMKKLASFD